MSERAAISSNAERPHGGILERRKTFFEKLSSPGAKWLALALLALESQACTKTQWSNVAGALTLEGKSAGGGLDLGFQAQGQSIGPGVRLESKAWPPTHNLNSAMSRWREAQNYRGRVLSGYYDPSEYAEAKKSGKPLPPDFINLVKFGFMPGDSVMAVSQGTLERPETRHKQELLQLLIEANVAKLHQGLKLRYRSGLRLNFWTERDLERTEKVACLLRPLTEGAQLKSAAAAGPTEKLEVALLSGSQIAARTEVMYSEEKDDQGRPAQAAVVVWYKLDDELTDTFLDLEKELLEREKEVWESKTMDEDSPKFKHKIATIEDLKRRLYSKMNKVREASLEALVPHLIPLIADNEIRIYNRMNREKKSMEFIAVVDHPPKKEI
jgi:hypothetical protein